MKKFILSAVAAGALAIGSAASAQDLGTVITEILRNTQTQQYGNVYYDQWGRQVYIDQYGRQVLVNPNVYGNSVYGNTVVDQLGRIISGVPYGYGVPTQGDHDGDGVPDSVDKCFNDKTCW